MSTQAELAKKIARDILQCGDGTRGKCKRIQFKIGDWPDNEHSNGGLCEEAPASVILKSLRKHTAKDDTK
jgi:hypothetical protein